MKKYLVTTGSITYAIKGKDILRKKGFNATIERKTSGVGSSGCGYSIIFSGDYDEAVKLLNEFGIKIIEINEL